MFITCDLSTEPCGRFLKWNEPLTNLSGVLFSISAASATAAVWLGNVEGTKMAARDKCDYNNALWLDLNCIVINVLTLTALLQTFKVTIILYRDKIVLWGLTGFNTYIYQQQDTLVCCCALFPCPSPCHLWWVARSRQLSTQSPRCPHSSPSESQIAAWNTHCRLEVPHKTDVTPGKGREYSV